MLAGPGRLFPTLASDSGARMCTNVCVQREKQWQKREIQLSYMATCTREHAAEQPQLTKLTANLFCKL